VTTDTTCPARSRPAPADDDAGDAEELAGEDRRPRYTMWAGGVAATGLVALALWGGAHLSVLLPGMRPAWLAGLVGVVLAWLVVAVLGWCAAELLKTHHRAMRAAAWRGTRRSGAWAWRTGRHHGGRAVVWAGGRWQQRTGGSGPPSMFGRWLAVLFPASDDDGEDPDGDQLDGEDPDGSPPSVVHETSPADATCPRIAAAIARAWGAPPLSVKPVSAAIDGPDHYYASLPPGVLTVPRDRSAVRAALAAAAGVLAHHLGGPVAIVDGWHTPGGPVVVLHTGAPQPADAAPEPPSGSPAGRVVYMTGGRIVGGTETAS
jgi:hypothetical protein